MIKKRKIYLLIGGGVIGLTILFFLVTYIRNTQYRNQIPDIPESANNSMVVQEQLNEAYEKAYRKPSAQNLGELGMAFHSSANYTHAAQSYQLAIKKDKKEWKWNYYLGYLHKELGESGKVIEYFNRVVELNPDAYLAWYYLGEANRNIRKMDLAEKAYSRILNTHRKEGENKTTTSNHQSLNIYGLFQLSKIYEETDRLDLAEETIRKLLIENDLYGPAYRVLGSIYRKKGDDISGNEYNIRANDLLPFSPPVDSLIDKLALMSRSELYLLKKIDEKAITSNFGSALLLVNHGMKYLPDNRYFLSKAIGVFLASNMNNEAIKLVDKHKSYFMNDYPELSLTGNHFYQKGLYSEAIKYWERAVELESGYIDILKKLALSYWRIGERAKTEEILTEAAEKNRDNPEFLADIVFAFLQFRYIDKANEYHAKLHQLPQNNPKIQKINGKAAEYRGNFKEAISYYEASFKSNPQDEETIHYLGELLLYEEMWEKYIEFLKDAIKHNPNSPELLDKVSAVLINCPDNSLRNYDEGIKYSIRAFTNTNSPFNVVLSSGKNLAFALLTKGDKQNALNIIQKTINLSQSVETPENVKQELDQLYQAIQSL